MTIQRIWTGSLASLLLVLTGCTAVSIDDGTANNVNVTVQALYEKPTLSSAGFGSLSSRPSRYALLEIHRNSDNSLIGSVGLGANGAGTLAVPRGTAVYAVVYADVLAPTPSGTGFSLHGSVKKSLPKSSYTTGSNFEAEPTWYTTSSTFTADNSGTLTVTALASTSEAGAFAIADQMVEFALGMGRVEATLPLPNLHAFWTSGTGSTYPGAVTNASGTILTHPYSNRPILANEIWYGGPNNCADAFNDSLLQETFAHALFAYGSYWSTNAQSQTTYGSIIRGDNDAAYTSPWIAAESTIAFANGFGYFLSSAFRDDSNHYLVATDGSATSWRLDQHDFTPTAPGEFYASCVARSLWGTWKTALGGGQTSLQTLWNATVPSLANQSYEYGNAPLGCYPTYLVGLKRLATTTNAAAVQAQLDAEHVSTINALYFDSTALWIPISVSGSSISGSLTTYDNSNASYRGVYYDRDQAQAYRFVHGGGARTITLSSSAPGLVLELFDSVGYVTGAKSTPSQSATLALSNLPFGTYAVRVRLNPAYVFNGNPATYSLTVN